MKLNNIQTPTEVDHYQIQRVVDIYVTPATEDLGKVSNEVARVIPQLKVPENVRINMRGMVQGMNASFRSFASGFRFRSYCSTSFWSRSLNRSKIRSSSCSRFPWASLAC